MGFWRERSQRHAGRVEAFDDCLFRFDLFHRDWVWGFQVEKVSDDRDRPVIYAVCVMPVIGIIAGQYCTVQRCDNVRVVGVVFPAVYVFQQATLELLLSRVPGFFGKLFQITFDFSITDTLDTADSPGKAGCDDFVVHSYDFKKLCAAVTGYCRDTHFGNNLL